MKIVPGRVPNKTTFENVLVPKGNYQAMIEDIRDWGDGAFWDFRIILGDYENERVSSFTLLPTEDMTEEALVKCFMLARFVKALSKEGEEIDEIEWEVFKEVAIGQLVVVEVAVEFYKEKKVSSVKNFTRL